MNLRRFITSLGRHLRAHVRFKVRALRALRVSQIHRKTERTYNQKSKIVLIGVTDNASGLARAYRYEAQRISHEERSRETSFPDQTFLLLGQPRSYKRLLASAPEGFRDGYRIGLWATEFETMPPDWRFAFDVVHEIWTPSEFCARAIRAATNLPVKIVPHAVSIPDVAAMDRTRFKIGSDQFLGLAIMDLRNCPDRKNPVAHVRAWKMAFGGDPSAHLLMKVRFSPRTQFMKQELLKAIEGAENISLTEIVFSDLEITAFQKMGDVFLSLHRSEGYGLNIREMLEIGITTLATGWSGNVDFMPLYPNAISIPYELVPYQDRTFHYEGDQLRWAEADVARAAMDLKDIRQKWQDARRATPLILVS